MKTVCIETGLWYDYIREFLELIHGNINLIWMRKYIDENGTYNKESVPIKWNSVEQLFEVIVHGITLQFPGNYEMKSLEWIEGIANVNTYKFTIHCCYEGFKFTFMETTIFLNIIIQILEKCDYTNPLMKGIMGDRAGYFPIDWYDFIIRMAIELNRREALKAIPADIITNNILKNWHHPELNVYLIESMHDRNIDPFEGIKLD